ncbi:MAG: hypothetical protein CM1200mP2_41170 [Planctomycetaceae bacterium]|nr:MAG: hypothetical protein CM1200mP2_41170 [Planctomycetaceae bacterium]
MPRQQQKSGGLSRRQVNRTGAGLAPLAFLANEANGASLHRQPPPEPAFFFTSPEVLRSRRPST